MPLTSLYQISRPEDWLKAAPDTMNRFSPYLMLAWSWPQAHREAQAAAVEATALSHTRAGALWRLRYRLCRSSAGCSAPALLAPAGGDLAGGGGLAASFGGGLLGGLLLARGLGGGGRLGGGVAAFVAAFGGGGRSGLEGGGGFLAAVLLTAAGGASTLAWYCPGVLPAGSYLGGRGRAGGCFAPGGMLRLPGQAGADARQACGGYGR
jgi:hypothetical protein